MKRILLVDDSPRFAREARAFLAGAGAGEVEWVPSAEAAVEWVARGGVDLVLMDIALPGLDGLEATRRLKKQSSVLPVVILTLHDNGEYERSARAAGADGFVSKRAMGDTLLPLLEQLLERKGS